MVLLMSMNLLPMTKVVQIVTVRRMRSTATENQPLKICQNLPLVKLATMMTGLAVMKNGSKWSTTQLPGAMAMTPIYLRMLIRPT